MEFTIRSARIWFDSCDTGKEKKKLNFTVIKKGTSDSVILHITGKEKKKLNFTVIKKGTSDSVILLSLAS